MDFESGHFSSPKKNCEYVTSKYPKLVFKGLVHEYSNGSNNFWEILFSNDKGIFYKGKKYNEDHSCYPLDIKTEGVRICGYKVLDDETRTKWTGEMYYPDMEIAE